MKIWTSFLSCLQAVFIPLFWTPNSKSEKKFLAIKKREFYETLNSSCNSFKQKVDDNFRMTKQSICCFEWIHHQANFLCQIERGRAPRNTQHISTHTKTIVVCLLVSRGRRLCTVLMACDLFPLYVCSKSRICVEINYNRVIGQHLW